MSTADLVNLIKLALVTLNTSDSEELPQVQLEYMEKVNDAILILPYGLTSRPIEGDTLAIVFSIQGQEENRFAIPLGTTNRKRKLKDGESVFENQKTKGFLYHRADGTLQIDIPKDVLEEVGGKVVVNVAGNAELNSGADVIVTAADEVNITADELSLTIEGNSSIECNGTTTIKGDDINLGDIGGQPVARIGDSTSDGATIVTGSGRVRCN